VKAHSSGVFGSRSMTPTEPLFIEFARINRRAVPEGLAAPSRIFVLPRRTSLPTGLGQRCRKLSATPLCTAPLLLAPICSSMAARPADMRTCGCFQDVSYQMRKKKPRKSPSQPAALPQGRPLSRRLPSPAPRFSRALVILAVYAASIIAISVVGVATATAIFWMIRGSPISSGPGLTIYVIGMVTFLWPALYLIGEL